MKPCPFCGEMIQDAAIKCRYCAEWLVDADASVMEPNSQKHPLVPNPEDVASSEESPEATDDAPKRPAEPKHQKLSPEIYPLEETGNPLLEYDPAMESAVRVLEVLKQQRPESDANREFRFSVNKEYVCEHEPKHTKQKVLMVNISDGGALLAPTKRSPGVGTVCRLYRDEEVRARLGEEDEILGAEDYIGKVIRTDRWGRFAIRFIKGQTGQRLYAPDAVSEDFGVTCEDHSGIAIVSLAGAMSVEKAAAVDQIIRATLRVAPISIINLTKIINSPGIGVLSVGLKQSITLRKRVAIVANDDSVAERFLKGTNPLPVYTTNDEAVEALLNSQNGSVSS